MAFSVYSKIAKKYKFHSLGHTMTGFGPVADSVERSRSNMRYVSMPPYILAPVSDNISSDGTSLEERPRVLFCAYCLSEDQRWLLASVVRDNGEVSYNLIVTSDVYTNSCRFVYFSFCFAIVTICYSQYIFGCQWLTYLKAREHELEKTLAKNL